MYRINNTTVVHVDILLLSLLSCMLFANRRLVVHTNKLSEEKHHWHISRDYVVKDVEQNIS